MKTIVLLLFTLLAFSTTNAEDAPGRTGKHYVQIYLKENFMGQAIRIPVPSELTSDAQLKTFGIPNDSIASMKIPDGVVVTLFDASGFHGDNETFEGKVPSVGKMKGLTSSLKAVLK